MTSSQRRFEILLPQRFNDGKPVPDELLADTLLDLRQRFGAVASETQIIRGVWEHAGQILKVRFQQIEIRITSYLIEVY